MTMYWEIPNFDVKSQNTDDYQRLMVPLMRSKWTYVRTSALRTLATINCPICVLDCYDGVYAGHHSAVHQKEVHQP